MSLSKVAPRHRFALRLHGWLLLIWSLTIGALTSALLLHVLHVGSMAVRYAVASAALYLVGFVFGGWCYARWLASRNADLLPRHATQQEEVEYDQHPSWSRRVWRKIDGFPDLSGGGGEDPLSIILMVFTLLLFVCMLGVLLIALPGVAGDALGAFLAEIVFEFVIGAVVLRRLLRPRPVDGYLEFAVRNTWKAGFALIFVCTLAGFAMQKMVPEAKTFAQFVRNV